MPLPLEEQRIIRTMVGRRIAEDFARALDDICSFAEKRMTEFTREDDAEHLRARRDSLADRLFLDAYGPLSQLWARAKREAK